MKTPVTLLLFLILPLACFAQPGLVFKRLNVDSSYTSDGTYFTVAYGKLYFKATTPAYGTELWVLDDSLSKPRLLKDIAPGNDSSMPGQPFAFNGKLYFGANDKAHGFELWVTDGTTAGTQLVKDINPGTAGMGADQYSWLVFTPYNGALYFTATDGTHGKELWQTDGTASGTQMIDDINPGSDDSYPAGFFVALNKLFFFAQTPAYGEELWISDGTSAGTNMVKDINAGPDGSVASPYLWQMDTLNGKICFAGYTNANGLELWTSDGTTSGTQLLKDINQGSSSSIESVLLRMDGRLFFAAHDTAGIEIWGTNGSANGTQRIKDIWSGTQSGVTQFFPTYMSAATYNHKLYFHGNDGTQKGLWVTDGTDTGTHLVKNGLQASDREPLDSRTMTNIGVFNNRLYFTSDDGSHGTELWVTDGTTPGTKMVNDISGGANYSSRYGLVEYKHKLYYQALCYSVGMSLYRCSDTGVGAIKVAPPTAPKFNSMPFYNDAAIFDSSLYLVADFDSTGYKVWSITDTGAPPEIIKPLAHHNSYDFEMYPNPNSGNFTLLLNSSDFASGSIMIYDILGRVVYDQPLPKTQLHQIALTDKTSGVYFLKLRVDNDITVKRFVLE